MAQSGSTLPDVAQGVRARLQDLDTEAENAKNEFIKTIQRIETEQANLVLSAPALEAPKSAPKATKYSSLPVEPSNPRVLKAPDQIGVQVLPHTYRAARLVGGRTAVDAEIIKKVATRFQLETTQQLDALAMTALRKELNELKNRAKSARAFKDKLENFIKNSEKELYQNFNDFLAGLKEMAKEGSVFAGLLGGQPVNSKRDIQTVMSDWRDAVLRVKTQNEALTQELQRCNDARNKLQQETPASSQRGTEEQRNLVHSQSATEADSRAKEETLREQVQALETTNKVLRDTILRNSNELEELKTRNSELTESGKKWDEERKTLLTTISERERTISDIKAAKRVLEQQLTEHSNELAQYRATVESLKSEKSALEDEKKRKESELQSVKNSLAEADAKVFNLTLEKSRLEQQARICESVNDTKKKEVEDLRREVAEIRNALLQTDNERSKAKFEGEQLESQLAQKESEINGLKNQLKGLQDSNARLEKTVSEASNDSAELKRLRTVNSELTQSGKMWEDKRQQMQKTIDDQERRIQELVAEKNTFQEVSTATTKILNEKDDLIKQNSSKIAEFRAKSEALEREKDEWEQEKKRKEAELEAARTELQSARDERAKLLAEKWNLESKAQTCESLTAEMTKERDNLQKQLADISAKLLETENQLVAAKDKGSEWQSKLAQKESENQQLRNHLQKCMEETKALKTKQMELEKCQRDYSDLDGVNAILDKQLKETIKEHQTLSEKFAKLQANNSQKEFELQHLTDQVMVLTASSEERKRLLTTKDEELEKLRGEHMKLALKISEYESQIRSLQVEQKVSTEELQRRVDENKILLERLTSQTTLANNLSTQLTKAQQDLENKNREVETMAATNTVFQRSVQENAKQLTNCTQQLLQARRNVFLNPLYLFLLDRQAFLGQLQHDIVELKKDYVDNPDAKMALDVVQYWYTHDVPRTLVDELRQTLVTAMQSPTFPTPRLVEMSRTLLQAGTPAQPAPPSVTPSAQPEQHSSSPQSQHQPENIKRQRTEKRDEMRN